MQLQEGMSGLILVTASTSVTLASVMQTRNASSLDPCSIWLSDSSRNFSTRGQGKLMHRGCWNRYRVSDLTYESPKRSKAYLDVVYGWPN